MDRIRTLEPVLRLAREREETESRRLQELRQRVQQEKGRLEQLISYRKGYCQRDWGGGQVAPRDLSAFQDFLGRLEQAVGQQQSQIKLLEGHVDAQVQVWRAAHVRVQSLERLIEKAKLEKALQVAKREQRMLDEFASQRFVRSRKPS